MSWFKPSRPPSAPADSSDVSSQHHDHLSDNAQAWRRLARDGYGRTAEQVRASQAAPLQREIDDNPER